MMILHAEISMIVEQNSGDCGLWHILPQLYKIKRNVEEICISPDIYAQLYHITSPSL